MSTTKTSYSSLGTIIQVKNLAWHPSDFGFERIAELPRWRNGKYRLFQYPNNVWTLLKYSTDKAGNFNPVVTFYLQIFPTDVIGALSVFNTIKGIGLTEEAKQRFKVIIDGLLLPSYKAEHNLIVDNEQDDETGRN